MLGHSNVISLQIVEMLHKLLEISCNMKIDKKGVKLRILLFNMIIDLEEPFGKIAKRTSK